VTGQLDDGPSPASESGLLQQSPQTPISPGGWQFQQPQMQPQHQFDFGAQQPFVQPHINPRFASQFGMNFGFMQPQFYPQHAQYGFNSNNANGSHSGGRWADEWTVHGGDISRSADDAGTGDQSTGAS
jgi:H/ACA ribonucleoprotein complex non-core subunit NAF1